MVLTRLLLTSLAIGSFCYVSYKVPFPYMDEIFHIPQTLQYIHTGDFVTWDPKITTPPGLYYLGYAASFVLSDSVSALRSVNLIALLMLLWTQPAHIAAFPLLAFFANLYYTDVWSTVLVLVGMARTTPDAIAGSLFLSSVLFRQTNIVWAGLSVALFALGDLEFLEISITSVRDTIRRALSVSPVIYGLVIAFGAFLHYNGGIALGDKTNHAVALHFAQLLYYLSFFALFSAPLAWEWIISGKFFKRIYLVPIEMTLIVWVIQKGTVIHPFILADNRHFTFYIWRRLITPFHGKLMVPVYWGAWRWFASTMNFGALKSWTYIAAVMAVLVPSPLMEPRYYIVPYLIWRRFFMPQKTVAKELVWYTAIELVTVVVFSQSLTHFMW